MRRRFFCTWEGNAAVADGANRNPLSFQDMILTLHNYWSARGCAILQPYDMRVGAGTSHPATTLRSLGPEPWHVAYVQPSRRPTAGRYAENPNRLQHYLQYPVILNIGRASGRARVWQSMLSSWVPLTITKKNIQIN